MTRVGAPPPPFVSLTDVERQSGSPHARLPHPEQMRLANPFCRFLELARPAPGHAPRS